LQVEGLRRRADVRRVLQPTGSLCPHGDPTANHYLKVLLDAMFGPAETASAAYCSSNPNESSLRVCPFSLTARTTSDGNPSGVRASISTVTCTSVSTTPAKR